MKKSSYFLLICIVIILPITLVYISSMLYISRYQAHVELQKFTYQERQATPNLSIQTQSSFFPATYWMLDYIVQIRGYVDYGIIPIRIQVEIPGVTSPWEQLIEIGRDPINLRIRPPLLQDGIDLSNSTTAVLQYSITNQITEQVLASDSITIDIASMYEMMWVSPELGEASTFALLSWMEPTAPQIQELLRQAVDYLTKHTDGKIDMMIGYQDLGLFDDPYENTRIQVVGIQGALSDLIQMRYVNTVFAERGEQRIKTPSQTIDARSGVCAETILVMASALQASGMNVMFVFPPGHAQVAVEAWPDSGDYFLIETTILPMGHTERDWNRVVTFKTKDEWRRFLAEVDEDGNRMLVINADLNARMGIPSLYR